MVGMLQFMSDINQPSLPTLFFYSVFVSSCVLCLMFVYFFVVVVLCGFVSGLILWFLDNLWFDDLRAL